MSDYLRLIILGSPSDLVETCVSDRNCLEMQDYDLFCQLGKRGGTANSQVRLIPSQLWVLIRSDEGPSEQRKTDGYENELTFIYAEDLRKLTWGGDNWSQAILTFVRALHPKTPIILYWH